MILVNILGQIIGFLFFALIVYAVYKSVKLNPSQFQLMEDEKILKNVKGDYWVRVLTRDTQNSGEFAFTNKRILFRTNFQLFLGIDLAIPYSEIVSVEKSNVRGIFPVAFTVKTVKGESYKFAIMKRDIYIDLINSEGRKEQ